VEEKQTAAVLKQVEEIWRNSNSTYTMEAEKFEFKMPLISGVQIAPFQVRKYI